ncbi:phage recombination protein Bet [Enterococcus xiangfangensis]|uniref:Phage recombination protein Bet n=1 Tax=Enterococcus xiangfangensis TaxID=1296537 RepID=A0ABU3F9E8_9ENTE|nr:phage recombination protein Bet [Enterococcus xiangfangensis]MDT2759301.1 phage recombination protein Bet [Enterococcus xiangfangensis]
MSNELLEKPIEYEVNGEEVKLTGNMVKQYLVSGNGNVTDQELVMFLQLAKYQKLNPFLNEAYLVKFGSQPAQIIVSKEAFMKRAENHPQYDGFEAGIVVQRGDDIKELPGAIKLPKDILIGGWAKVYRKDRSNPIVSQVALEEFSKGQATWKNMPNTMIRKTAIVNALRESFPDSLGAMYTEDDQNIKLQQNQSQNITPEPEKTKAIENKLFNQIDNSESDKNDVESYFNEQYEKLGIKVVPGHWPEMKTKEDVDNWINNLKMIDEALGEMEDEDIQQETLDLTYPDPNAQNFDREDVTPNDDDGEKYPF